MTDNGEFKNTNPAVSSTEAVSDLANALSVRSRLARDERGAALRAIAGRLAHQIRNPLAAVRAACSSLHADIEDPEQRETLELTLKEIDRMLTFVSATVQTTPINLEKPQAINIRTELANVVDIVRSGYADQPTIELHGDKSIDCLLPRDEFRLSVYSLLEHLIGATSLTGIAVHAGTADGKALIRFDVRGASSNDVALTNGMVAAQNGLQPVGLLVAERFARDLGGRLMRSDDGDNTQTFSLELPCTNV